MLGDSIQPVKPLEAWLSEAMDSAPATLPVDVAKRLADIIYGADK